MHENSFEYDEHANGEETINSANSQKLIKAKCSSRNTKCNLIWTSLHLKPHALRALYPWQRVNHFPRSYLLTRKDKLYECLARAKALYGHSYAIFPDFFVTPRDYERFVTRFKVHSHGLKPYIVKPVASSRGKGIFIVQTPEAIPLGSPMLVSQYIENPYLLNGHKFDLRLYVLVTSFCPLIVYMYNEGLTRFASEKYSCASKNYEQFFSHLTNYSLNKWNGKFVKNANAHAEDEGHKWTLGALLRRLQSDGVDTKLLMVRIEDVVVKALLSVQGQITAACRNVLTNAICCFEVFGFDILIDSGLKPWILEVNLSPSLSCDSPLDLQLKSSLICDVLSMAKIPLGTPVCNSSKKMSFSPNDVVNNPKRRSKVMVMTSKTNDADEYARINVERCKIELERCGGFVRLFPRENSYQIYSHLIEDYDDINWDAQLYADIYGEVDDDYSTLPQLVHDELLATDRIKTSSSLSPDVLHLLEPAMKDGERYLARMTHSSVNYASKLPKLRPELRKRSKSMEAIESLPNLMRSSGTDDVVYKNSLHIDADAFDKVPQLDVNCLQPLKELTDVEMFDPKVTDDLKASLNGSFKVDENAAPQNV